MSEVIRKWIASRMGILLDSNVDHFGQLVKDGNLISQILCNYGILKTEEICPTSEDFDICYTNLNCLTEVLKPLGIYLSDANVQIIAKGDGPQAYKFFYKLYLVLHDKSKVDYMLKSKLGEKFEEIQSAPTSEIKTDGYGTEVPNYDSTKALFRWHKNNIQNLHKKNAETRDLYLKKFQEEINAPDLDPEKMDKNNCKDIEKRLKDMFHNIPDVAVDISGDSPPQVAEKFDVMQPDRKSATKYLQKLKEKYRKSEENKILQTYMHKLLLSDFQTKYRHKQDTEFNAAVMRKVLRQSNYEKQMASKLLEIYNQKDRVMENRRRINEMVEAKRDQRFVSELSSTNYNVTLASLKDYNERKRILELHKKLYEEKMQRRFLRHYELCRSVVQDLVDLSIKTSEYMEKYETPVPDYVWRNWVTLFIKEQKLLTKPMRLEEVLDFVEEEENSEYFRQSYLDEEDVDNYIKQENGWFLEELENYYLTLSEIIKLGENVLSHIVNKLLLVKYPKPPLPRCPSLPVVTTACAIIGLENDTHLKILQKILMKRSIIVVNETEITNYCLHCFRVESQTGEIDEHLDAETQKGKKALKGGQKKPAPKEKKKGAKIGKTPDTGGVSSYPKETQTPKYFPDEEIKLSPAAQLGQIAYESLNLGLEISNYLFTKMLIEYLTTFKTIKGWVLVNYPENLMDAMALELALTGREVKDIMGQAEEDIDEDEQEESFISDSYRRSVSDIFAPPEDIYLQKRISKLCPIRGASDEPEPYRSYLTSFIRVIHSTPEKSTIELTASNVGFEIDDYTKVEEFYEKLKCKSSITYKDFDADTVRDLVNEIVHDNIFGLLIYNEIIRTVFDCMEEKRKQEEDRKSISKGKKDKDKKVVQEPPKKPKSIVINLPRVSTNQVQPARPGESHWEYVDLPLPNEYQKQLASFWEDIEFAYLNDFRQIFFQFRLAKNSLVPYYHNVFSHMSNFITRPDNKQEFLHRFQLAFNDLDNDLREDDEFKTELHCRIMDFKSKMWEICICRMRESEDERLRNIQENWYTELCVEVVNLLLSAMQLEIDRYVSTTQLLTDYYTFMATNELSGTKYNKINLVTYQIDERLIIFVREAYININNKIQRTPFVNYMNTILKNTLQFVNQVYQMGTSAMSIMSKLIQEPKGSKKKPLVQKTNAQEPGDSAATMKNMIALHSEWSYAVEGEYSRAKFRLSLLEARACQELDEIVLQGEKLFHGIYEKLDKRNQDELQTVNLACEIFHRATETCENVQPRLVISGAKFYMDGKEIMYNDVYQPMLPYLDETTMDIFYTIPQLHKLTKILLDLAPNGSLPLKTFTFLIEDMAAHQSDSGLNTLLPLYWHHLETDQLKDVLNKIFGDIEYINWKDFIVYNLELPFPSEQELLDVREQFRSMDPDKLEYVNEVQFNRVEFWFENIELIRQTYNKQSIKKLLATMFEIRTDCINYSALLLTFCKDQDPVVGVAKAFGLCIGKLVCWNIETGLNYIEILRYQKFMDQDKNLSVVSEVESQSNYSETKFPSNVDFPKEPDYPKESFENVSDGGLDSLFVENESLEEEEVLSPPSLCYVLPFNIILTIMTAALPWHTRVQCVQDKSLKEFLEVIYENCRNEEFQLVFTHDFLNNDDLKNYITVNYKFNVRSPASFVQMKIEKCFCRKETLSESDK